MSTTLTVEGVTCGHCEQTVEEALEDIAGVRDAEETQLDAQRQIE